ncbi:bifunctional fucokinase/fucose-1-phosphate guanylyltransferase [Thermophagus xiamenensis]|uniref:Predicted kinase n=1 Tax=Thermophagus xiamenensis TaxID=385682 RepID=A0A1I2DJ10_9BACT|nr:bifunctional fucokinase/fucose-1-phosphate guanylyltransferase [Thermophagus xiamenensis]SFE80428.1 Predicted kinase [Thermophagus xiamenensis]
MKLLLSLPENLANSFNHIGPSVNYSVFVSSDPPKGKIGSGGGTAWLLSQHFATESISDFDQYLKADKKIIIHAGGQSRRLPAYAPLGKIFTPIPVFRWSRGQKLNQTLLDLQLPLYEYLMAISSPEINTMIASGDILLQYNKLPAELPKADVICLGMWVDPHLAARHGVFFTPRNDPSKLDFMLQKPSHQKIEELNASHLFLMDVGIWLLSDNAVRTLMQKCQWKDDNFLNNTPPFYDLYSTFGTALGSTPTVVDEAIGKLSVAIIPIEKGEFHHFGTSNELITSTEKIQNSVKDRRNIWHNRVKPHPSLFVQNAQTHIRWEATHHHIWIENSNIPDSWTLSNHHVITGIPENNWKISLNPGWCLDIIPIEENKYCIRPYHIDDKFSGKCNDQNTFWLGIPLNEWLRNHQITFNEAAIDPKEDIQEASLFPVVTLSELTEELLIWMFSENPPHNSELKSKWLSSTRLSGSKIPQKANIARLIQQRETIRKENLLALEKNYKHSVFYQADLAFIAQEYAKNNLTIPDPLPKEESFIFRFQNYMLRSEIKRLQEKDGANDESLAFSLLQQFIINTVEKKEIPRLNVFPDQIVWGRSPARLDLAGGWSDTPPYCIQAGGRVLNLAVNLNGQPPLQVFIRLSNEPQIILRSIDIGATETIATYDDLNFKNSVGSAFAIPKAALCLAGFHPSFSDIKYKSLKEQLVDFGGGIEISFLAAIPKGSGLGTSSILAATILGTLADFCNLSWDRQAIAHRTLVLEQLLTTGGGWQDQYGGIFPGIKLLDSSPGNQNQINIRWIPDLLFTNPPFRQNWLLYYTGLTRVAKNILGEIVRGMFLNQGTRLRIIDTIKNHALETYDALQQCNYEKSARMILRSWELNKALDLGTTNPEINAIIDKIKDLAFGYKLLGAGGGGYLLIAAKDEGAAARIKERLTKYPPNSKARFVDMSLNNQGLEISRS